MKHNGYRISKSDLNIRGITKNRKGGKLKIQEFDVKDVLS